MVRESGKPRVASWAAPLVVVLATLAAFLPALNNGFVWDDDALLVFNPVYRSLGPRSLRWMFTTTFMGPYMPLSWLSYAVDYQLWGMKPAGYHLTNVVLHVANAAIFYLIALRLLRSSRLVAALTALLFAVHPLRVESVAWVTERRDVLSGFFYLGAAWLHLRGKRAARLTAFALALLAKAITLTLPIALLIIDRFHLRKPWREALIDKLPFLPLALAAAAAGYVGQAQSKAMEHAAQYDLGDRLVRVLHGLAFYAWKTILPFKLMPLAEFPPPGQFLDPLLGGALAGLALLFFFIALRRRWPAGLAVWIFYAATLAPVLGFVHFGMQLVADRHSYLSCLGWPLLAGAGLMRLSRSAALGLGAAAVLALGTRTFALTRIWHDEKSLWGYAVRTDPNQAIARNKYGSALMTDGKIDEAIREYQKALALNPSYAAASFNLGVAYARTGNRAEAARRYEETLKMKPNFVQAHIGLGQLLASEGRIEEARAHFQEAARINPGYVEAFKRLERPR